MIGMRPNVAYIILVRDNDTHILEHTKFNNHRESIVLAFS